MSESTKSAESGNTQQVESSGQDRPSVVEPAEMVQRSAGGDRTRVTERSDVRYFSRGSGDEGPRQTGR